MASRVMVELGVTSYKIQPSLRDAIIFSHIVQAVNDLPKFKRPAGTKSKARMYFLRR